MRRDPVTTDDIDRGLGGFLPDAGCDLHAHCLTCPLSTCRFDMPPNKARVGMEVLQLSEHLEAGKTVSEVAELMRISRTTVYRLWKRKRKGQGHGRTGGGA